MEAYAPFIHHLKEIVCTFRETGTVSLRTLAASETYIEAQNFTSNASDNTSISLGGRRKSTNVTESPSDSKTERKTKSRTGPLQCCGKTFVYPSQYEIHARTLKHSNNVKCFVCHAHFLNVEELRQHKIDSHRRRKPCPICKICGAIFEDSYSLSLHVKNSHKEKKLVCTVCGIFKTDHKNVLNRHLVRWHSESSIKPYGPKVQFEPVKCCGLIFYFPSHLERHRRSLKHQKKFPCGQCKEMFDSKEALKQHKSDDHFHVDGKFQCLLCNNRYATNGILTVHINNVHSRATVYECSKCSVKTGDKWRLQRHYSTHHQENTETFACDTCGREFKRKDHLYIHKKIHTKRLYCTTCSITFEKAEALEKHKALHRPCQICGMTFRRNVTRESHMNSHLRSIFKETKARLVKDTCVRKRKRRQKKEKENLCSEYTNNADFPSEFSHAKPETKSSSHTLCEDGNPDSETTESLKEMPTYFNL